MVISPIFMTIAVPFVGTLTTLTQTTLSLAQRAYSLWSWRLPSNEEETAHHNATARMVGSIHILAPFHELYSGFRRYSLYT